MLLEILGIAALGVLGYNSLKDEESRTKTKGTIANVIEKAEKNITKKFNNGEMSDEEYTTFEEKFVNNRSNIIQWKIDAEMLKFKKETGYSEESSEYQDKLEYLQHKYFDY